MRSIVGTIFFVSCAVSPSSIPVADFAPDLAQCLPPEFPGGILNCGCRGNVCQPQKIHGSEVRDGLIVLPAPPNDSPPDEEPT